jgi:hypothetical protein
MVDLARVFPDGNNAEPAHMNIKTIFNNLPDCCQDVLELLPRRMLMIIII